MSNSNQKGNITSSMKGKIRKGSVIVKQQPNLNPGGVSSLGQTSLSRYDAQSRQSKPRKSTIGISKLAASRLAGIANS